MRGDGGYMDTQTMKDYIEDLLEERNDLFAKIRLLEETLTVCEGQLKLLGEVVKNYE
jgi:hypothetical protein